MKKFLMASVHGACFFMLLAGNAAFANPIQDTMIAECDTWSDTAVTEELGLFFPEDESIDIHAFRGPPAPFNNCFFGGDPNAAFFVEMVNLTQTTWQDVFMVGDRGSRWLNADGFSGTFGPDAYVMKIDAVGLNAPLVFESDIVDGLFQPDELWRFNVTGFYDNFSGPNAEPRFDSLGLNSPGPTSLSNASIVANVAVPVPAAIWLFGSALALVACRKRK